MKEMSFAAGTLSMAQLESFYNQAIGDNVYAFSKISVSGGPSIIGCIIDMANDKVRVFNIANKNEVVHISNIIKIQIYDPVSVENAGAAINKAGYVIIPKYEFPTYAEGYETSKLVKVIKHLLTMVKSAGGSGVLTTVDGEQISFTDISEVGYEQIEVDTTTVALGMISDIKIAAGNKNSGEADKGNFDNAMSTLAGQEAKHIQASGSAISAGWASYVINNFGDVGNLINVITKNGQSFIGNVKRYDDAGDEVVMVLQINHGYTAKNVGDTYAIRVSEISSITYSEQKAPAQKSGSAGDPAGFFK